MILRSRREENGRNEEERATLSTKGRRMNLRVGNICREVVMKYQRRCVPAKTKSLCCKRSGGHHIGAVSDRTQYVSSSGLQARPSLLRSPPSESKIVKKSWSFSALSCSTESSAEITCQGERNTSCNAGNNDTLSRSSPGETERYE